jgi:GPH family glycoside/pentoside/hexuronide:cation symporter
MSGQKPDFYEIGFLILGDLAIVSFNPSITKSHDHAMTLWRKLAYGFGDSGFSITSTALALLYLDFLINVVGLEAQLAGLAIGIGRLWDAGNDVIFGSLSDRTRSRWGRRRPYLLFGALPFGLAFLPMWLIPTLDSQVALALYYTAAYILFDTLFTLTNTPYVALTPDLAPSYDRRTSLHAWRMLFSIGFGLVGAVAPLAIVDIAGAHGRAPLPNAYAVMAAVLGLFSIAPIWIAFAATRERPEYQALPTPTLRQSLAVAFTNRAFLIAAGIYLLTWMPIDLITFVLVFLMRDVFGLGGGQRDLAFGLLFGIAAFALPLWVWLSARWDKRRAYQLGMAMLIVALIALSSLSAEQTALVFVVATIAGIGLSAAHAIPLAIVPDTLDWDELRRGTRQEAACYSVLTLAQKLVSAGTIALTGAMLAASGYTPGAPSQPESALNTIRLLTGWLPAVLFFAGIVLATRYPISRERHARIIRALERRRSAAQRRSTSPISTDVF